MPLNEREQLEQAIAALEAQRTLLGDAVVDAAIGPMREKLVALTAASHGEQRKLVTVLSADLAGWAAMSEQMDAEDVRTVQKAFFAAVTKAFQIPRPAVNCFIAPQAKMCDNEGTLSALQYA